MTLDWDWVGTHFTFVIYIIEACLIRKLQCSILSKGNTWMVQMWEKYMKIGKTFWANFVKWALGRQCNHENAARYIYIYTHTQIYTSSTLIKCFVLLKRIMIPWNCNRYGPTTFTWGHHGLINLGSTDNLLDPLALPKKPCVQIKQ